MTSSAPQLAPLYFAHPEALVETSSIGPRTRIWAFAHILAGARVGADCNICDHTFIEGGAIVGDRVTIKCGVELWNGVTLEDDVFVGPNATFTNDVFPRSPGQWGRFGKTLVKRGASIGANATILPGLVIGPNAMVGAGAVVTRDVPGRAIVVGNPASISGYVGIDGRPEPGLTKGVPFGLPESLPGGARLVLNPRISDSRGHLSFAEMPDALPFAPVRYFLIFGVPGRQVRGEHAHKTLHEYLVCTAGSCSVRLYDGERNDEVLLDRPDLGLHIPPMVWTTQYKYSADAVLLALASDIYSEGDYIRDLDEYQWRLAEAAK